MKNVLIVLGAAFLILIFIVATVIGCSVFFGSKLDATSKAYVDESVPAIVSTWSKDELIKRANSQFREKTTNAQVDLSFAAFQRLGPFQSYDGSKGQIHMQFNLKEGFVTTALYLSKATFQNGKIEVRITLIRQRDSWEILGFQVELE